MLRTTYTNPIVAGSFPDPFVLRFQGRYYAWGTGPAGDGRLFPMLSSPDLVRWTAHGGALAPLDLPGCEQYWAPEVAYREGRFYLYYAVGRRDDPDHHLRVATAEHPLGPWQDAGLNLTPHEVFAIDAHPFRDPADGAWYLFYARDSLIGPYAGTGVVVDRLPAPDRLEGRPREVRRPTCDWMVFELQRAVKGGLDWYTAEGPFTVCAGGRYVCFYSGGRYEHPNYGVGYALAGHPLGPWTDDANTAGPRVLTTVPGRVIGPGHNSVVVGPDLQTSWLVYHAWDPGLTARSARIDRLEWAEGRPFVPGGPSTRPRPAPRPPDLLVRFDGALQRARRLDLPPDDVVIEVSFRLRGEPGPVVTVGRCEVEIEIGREGSFLAAGAARAPLPADFHPAAWHTLHLWREGGRLRVELDGLPGVEVPLAEGPRPLGLPDPPGIERGHLVWARRRPALPGGLLRCAARAEAQVRLGATAAIG
jgi:GH43 family beta-xylosidase